MVADDNQFGCVLTKMMGGGQNRGEIFIFCWSHPTPGSTPGPSACQVNHTPARLCPSSMCIWLITSSKSERACANRNTRLLDFVEYGRGRLLQCKTCSWFKERTVYHLPFLSIRYRYRTKPSKLDRLCRPKLNIIFPSQFLLWYNIWYLLPKMFDFIPKVSHTSFIVAIKWLQGDTGCPKKKDTVTLSHNFRLNYSNSKFQTRFSA